MISIIIRTLGRDSLAEAIASVAAQGRGDVEVIVVDASGQLQLPPVDGVPVRVVGNGQRLHRSVAASMGLAAVTTRWAGFLDDDDVLLPGHLDKLVPALQAAPHAVLAYSGVELVRAGEEPASSPPPVLDEDFEPWQLLLGNRLPIHAVLFDAQRVQAAGADFDPTLDLYEDWDFWLQLRQLGDFVHVPGVSARYLLHESSGVHQVGFGDDTYWRVWLKWWPRAPRDWWVGALRAGTRAVPLQDELAATRLDLIAKLDAQHAQLVAALDDAWQLRRDVELHLQALAETQQQLAETQRQLAESRQLVELTVAQRDAISTALAQTQQSLGATQALLADESRALSETRQALAQSAQSLDEAHAGLQARDEELVRLQQSLAAQRVETERTAEVLQQVLGSRIWRATAPLRWLADHARGLRASAGRVKRRSGMQRLLSATGAGREYLQWVQAVEPAQRQQRAAGLTGLPPLSFSVLMPVFDPQLAWLDEAIASVQAQTHPHWELCLADDASTEAGVREHLRAWVAREPRIRLVERPVNGHISAASNSALALASGEWVVLLDQDDVLAPDALAELAGAATQHPDAGLLYSDEDKLDAAGQRFEPYFKPAFNLELLRGQNLISHLGAYRRSLVQAVGGFREGYEGSQDHDLALRCVERLQPSQVVHVPRVLYHWRAAEGSTAAGGDHKPYAAAAGLRAVQDHLARTAPGSSAEMLPGRGFFRVRLALPRVLPAVQAVVAVPAIDDAARAWAKALRESAGHPGFELSLVEVTAGDEASGLVEMLRAAAMSSAPLLMSLRYGLQPATPGWLAEMIGVAGQPGVGVVGGRVESPSGRVVDGCLIGGPQVAWRGLGRHHGGHFGRALLRQAVSAVGPSVLMVRREAASAVFGAAGFEAGRSGDALSTAWRLCEAARGQGWRVVWTPFAVLVESAAVRAGPAPASQGPEDVAPDDPASHPQLRLRDGRLVLREQAVPLQPRPGF